MLVAAALLAACGSVESTKLDVVPVKTTVFAFRDERPRDQVQTNISIGAVGKISYLGDDAISPSGPELIETWLSRRFAQRLAGKVVVLREFSVQIYEPPTRDDGAAERTARLSTFSAAGSQVATTPNANPLTAALGVGLANLLIDGLKGAGSDKTAGVRISGTADGAEFSGFGNGLFKGGVTAADLNGIILQALDDAMSDLEKHLAGRSAGSAPGAAAAN